MPTLHIVAGPNGAGKTTFYTLRLKRLVPDAEFVNADELALAAFGHVARTAAESARGQDLAEARRRVLMQAGADLVMESTFSHPSKVELVRDAKALGYEVIVYHVNVRDPDLSVLRVAHRVGRGGHPVPEEKIRQRYARNQPLIRDAARLADRTYVFDNSGLGKPYEAVLILAGAKPVFVHESLPAWVSLLYADELAAP